MPKINFILPNGDQRNVEAPSGLSVMEISKQHDFALEGACGGSLACATCHVIVAEEWFERLPVAKEDEETILDVAFGIQPTSRLGCQLIMTPELDGLVVKIVDERSENGFGHAAG